MIQAYKIDFKAGTVKPCEPDPAVTFEWFRRLGFPIPDL